ncbi:MAG: hypothetical protein ACLFRE_01090 [Desulfovermiculus sp.]
MALACTHNLEVKETQATGRWELQAGDTLWFKLSSTQSGQCREEDTLAQDPDESDSS